MANINIFALGGQDEKGKNSYVIKVEEEIFLFNAGIKIPIQNFHGIDGIIPEFEYIKKNADKVKGIFITHGHDEAFAALPWLIMEIPGLVIYGSEFTISVIKNRLLKYNLKNSNYKLKVITKQENFKDSNVKCYNVASSIPGTFVYNVQTKDGDIIFGTNIVVGDLGVYGNTDLDLIKKESNNILALLLDSRISHFSGRTIDHMFVESIIGKLFAEANPEERIIIGAYDEEMFVLEEVMHLAAKHERPIAIYGSAFAFLYKEKNNIYNKKDYFEKDAEIFKNNKPIKFIDYKEINNSKNAVVLVTSTWSRLFQRINRIAQNQDIYLKLRKHDEIIMLAPPENGMEVESSMSLDEVTRIAYNIYDIKSTDFYKARPAKQDIYDIINVLKPKIFIPISSLYRYMVVANKQAEQNGIPGDKNIILQNGKILYIKDGEIASRSGLLKEYGEVIIDGFGIGDISREVIKEREAMSSGGLIIIGQFINKKTKLPIGDANIQIVGLATKPEIPQLCKEINSIIKQKLSQLEKWNWYDAQTIVKKRVRKVMSRITNKEPVVQISYFEI